MESAREKFEKTFSQESPRDIYFSEARQPFDIKNKSTSNFDIENYWSAEGMGESLEQFISDKEKLQDSKKSNLVSISNFISKYNMQLQNSPKVYFEGVYLETLHPKLFECCDAI